MKGWAIFSHSVRLVLRNLHEALQIGLVPSVLMTAAIAFLVYQGGFFSTDLTDEAMLEQAVQQGDLNFGILALIPLLWVVVTLWIFVSWHRFVLLEEYPAGWIPPFRFELVLAYFGRFLLLILLTVIGFLLLTFIASALGAVGVPVLIVGGIAIAVYFYRLSVILPAAAIGRSLKFNEALGATKGATGAIIVLLLAIAIAQFLLQLAFGFALSYVPILGIAVQVVVTLIMSLVNVSVLTTLYGHYVEGRGID